MKKIAVVTCVELPEPDPDQEPLLDGLRGAGMQPKMLAWDDPNANPGDFDLCIMRSCWNYYINPAGFLAFVDRAATASQLVNPIDVVHWNLHKRYLKKLQAADVPIIPTVWLDDREPGDLSETMRTEGWDDVVIKPSVSAASYRTERFKKDRVKKGQRFLEELLADGDTLIQKYMSGFDEEKALVWIDGEWTHAVGKSPRFAGEDEEVSDALPMSDEERTLAAKALGCVDVDCDLLYARVDVIRDSEGKLLVSEIELVEPSLFFVQSPASLVRFVDAIGRWG